MSTLCDYDVTKMSMMVAQTTAGWAFLLAWPDGF